MACDRVIVLAAGKMVFDGPPPLLASEAEGSVWEARLAAGEEESLPDEALVVDQVPEEDGGSRVRILCSTEPLAHARPAAPTLEDGYLQLVGYRVGKSKETE